MAGLGPMEIALIVGAVMLLFGYKQLPKAARSLGQSMHILKTELGSRETQGEEPQSGHTQKSSL